MEKNYPKRQYLAGMLLPDDPDGGRLVKVGPENVGYCYLSLFSAIFQLYCDYLLREESLDSCNKLTSETRDLWKI